MHTNSSEYTTTTCLPWIEYPSEQIRWPKMSTLTRITFMKSTTKQAESHSYHWHHLYWRYLHQRAKGCHIISLVHEFCDGFTSTLWHQGSLHTFSHAEWEKSPLQFYACSSPPRVHINTVGVISCLIIPPVGQKVSYLSCHTLFGWGKVDLLWP